MRVLVTGATGMLGGGVVRALVERGADVVALVRPGTVAPDGSRPLAHDLVRPFEADALPDVACVIHLAHHPHVSFPDNATALHRLNTSSTQELLEASRRRGVERFVYASSGTVYGFADHPADEEETPRATDFYALTKLHAEQIVRLYARYFATTVVRPFFPYGTGQRDRLIARIAHRIAHGDPISLRADDGPRINPVYAGDAVEGIVAAAEGRTPEVLNLAGPDVVSIRDLATAIANALGREARFEELDDDTSVGDLVGTTQRLRDVLGRELVSLEEGLRRTLRSGGEPQSSEAARPE